MEGSVSNITKDKDAETNVEPIKRDFQTIIDGQMAFDEQQTEYSEHFNQNRVQSTIIALDVRTSRLLDNENNGNGSRPNTTNDAEIARQYQQQYNFDVIHKLPEDLTDEDIRAIEMIEQTNNVATKPTKIVENTTRHKNDIRKDKKYAWKLQEQEIMERKRITKQQTKEKANMATKLSKVTSTKTNRPTVSDDQR